ncbi:MAG: DUF6285 domain-containing protein [Hyphomicrobiaceae bacterium]|nr:DUF6285 domain-containing protein [Hyphomicrobiaceae bacterium]
MTGRASKAQTLIDVATDTFVHEIMPALPAEKRYTSAMTANALSIARRRLSCADPAESLLKAFGAENLSSLATRFRCGDEHNLSGKEAAAKLLTYLEAELAITNPRFLEQRKD